MGVRSVFMLLGQFAWKSLKSTKLYLRDFSEGRNMAEDNNIRGNGTLHFIL